MNQTYQAYQILVILHEDFGKLCDVSKKMLEVMNQDRIDNTVLSDEQRQSARIFIETINLLQGDQIIGEKQMTTNKTEVLIGDNARITGDFVVANSIKNSFNRIASSSASDELKELLKELSVAVGNMTEHLPKEESEEVAEDLDKLVDQATQEKPKRKWWTVSVDGLVKAAEKIGEVGKPVLDLAAKIVPLLTKLSP